MGDTDIRFVEKKVDESWKEQAAREKEKNQPSPVKPAAAGSQPSPSKSSSEAISARTSIPFLNLLKSLGYQVMIHLGELPHPSTGRRETDLEAARETIDLLLALKTKTQGNVGREEMEIFEGALPELQLKFAEKTT